SARSRPLPCGSPSTMSTSTTSASPASAIRWAVVAPTLPAPMTVTLLRAMWRTGSFPWAGDRLGSRAIVGRGSGIVVHGAPGWTPVDGGGVGLPATITASQPAPSPTPSNICGDTTMTFTPALALLGIVLVLVAIPFAFSLGPLVIGVLIL